MKKDVEKILITVFFSILCALSIIAFVVCLINTQDTSQVFFTVFGSVIVFFASVAYLLWTYVLQKRFIKTDIIDNVNDTEQAEKIEE